MKVKDIKQIECSVYGNVKGAKEGVLTLNDIIFTLGSGLSNDIKQLRSLPYHSEEQKQFKDKFPCWIPAGVLEVGKQHDSDIKSYSNILVIDIDKVDNPTVDLMNKIRLDIFNLPYVVGVFKSISGEGLYVLILVEDGKYTKDYYKYFINLFKSKFNIEIDKHCTNIARKRFVSYEDNIEDWIKDDDTDIKSWKLKAINTPTTIDEPIKQQIFTRRDLFGYKSDGDDNLTRKAIWLVLESGYEVPNYASWWHFGNEFKHFSDGYEMFVAMSNNYTKVHDSISDIDNQWKNCKAEGSIDDVNRKWRGMAKARYGSKWYQRVPAHSL